MSEPEKSETPAEQENKEPKTGNGKWLGLAILVVLIIGAVYVVATSFIQPNKSSNTTTAQPVTSLDKFAQCLADNGAKMYGAYWCPHCTNQQNLFGDSFKFIDYVECDSQGENPRLELCFSAGIELFPTWEINGAKHQGEQSLADLARISGCELPKL